MDHTTMAPAARVLLNGLVAALLLLPALARPAPGERSSIGNAESASGVQTAHGHYRAGRYEKAARLYQAAYRLDGDPAALFNAARAEQRGFQLEAARRDFERYLKLVGSEDKGSARARLHLQEIAEAQAALVSEHRRARKKADDDGWQTPAGWAALGIGAAGVGLGVWWLLSANLDSNQLDEQLEATKRGEVGLTYEGAQVENTRINDTLLRGYAALGVGAVAAGVGVWWLLRMEGDTSVALVPGPRGVGWGLAVQF